ncbi:APO protein 4 [Pyrus ussuriensis x Pyrus communis]|uniref:APO protein 4 n=1 Tax=Pyrus ussuriensis x Pyrus communis TaxID=2448454 RepID=A0A5N5F2R5_9ROSA|nr:APO protein 4 [Pyrus ussuriensis x Pyrus communis]
MALRKKLWESSNFNGKIMYSFARYYSSKMDLRKLKPMIQKRIQNRAKGYPVLDSRRLVMQGVSTLLTMIPRLPKKPPFCRFCPEVYIGEKGHLIQTCCGFKHCGKNQVHEWIVEAFHLKHMFQDIIKHHQRFDFERVPAVVELCWQAGANDGNHLNWNSGSDCLGVDGAEFLSPDELILVATGTLRAWEIFRDGVEKLLMVYPAKVCKHCSEVHIGPSGHKARLCGVFKYESWQGTHFWRKANMDDLVPPKTVWRRQPQDPQVLLNEGRGLYGHTAAVVELYHCMMKLQGVSTSLGDQRLLHPNAQMYMSVDSKVIEPSRSSPGLPDRRCVQNWKL